LFGSFAKDKSKQRTRKSHKTTSLAGQLKACLPLLVGSLLDLITQKNRRAHTKFNIKISMESYTFAGTSARRYRIVDTEER
jgi:hypothetical protein